MKTTSKELAITLQDLDYDGEFVDVYEDWDCCDVDENGVKHPAEIKLPRLDDVSYWLREKYNIYIFITYSQFTESWCCDIYNVKIGMYYDYSSASYDNWDDALEDGVKNAVNIVLSLIDDYGVHR